MGGVNATEFEIQDIDEVLEDKFLSTTTIGTHKIALPTASQVRVDYYFGSSICLGMHTGILIHNAI